MQILCSPILFSSHPICICILNGCNCTVWQQFSSVFCCFVNKVGYLIHAWFQNKCSILKCNGNGGEEAFRDSSFSSLCRFPKQNIQEKALKFQLELPIRFKTGLFRSLCYVGDVPVQRNEAAVLNGSVNQLNPLGGETFLDQMGMAESAVRLRFWHMETLAYSGTFLRCAAADIMFWILISVNREAITFFLSLPPPFLILLNNEMVSENVNL